MSPEEAASLLDAELRPYSWFLSVGVGTNEEGQPLLFVYTKAGGRREIAKLASGWMGYKVIARPVGSIRPVAQTRRRAAG